MMHLLVQSLCFAPLPFLFRVPVWCPVTGRELLQVWGIRVTLGDPSGDGSLLLPCSPGEPLTASCAFM